MNGTREIGERAGLRGFWAMNLTQMQGAFNDNLYRFAVIFFLVDRLAPGQDAAAQGTAMMYAGISTVLFAAAMLLMPGWAGLLSDRYSKRAVTIATKVWEVGVMGFAIVAFQLGDPWVLYSLLFLMFLQSAFFGPSKYGILPELLPEHRLSWANGWMLLFTYAAIILGQVVAGGMHVAVAEGGVDRWALSALLVLLSLGGLAAATFITRVASAEPRKPIGLNPWGGLGRFLGVYWNDRVLWLVLLGAGYFWFAGSVVQVNVFTHGKKVLLVNELWTSVLMVSVLCGIGLGSLVAGLVSKRKIELGLVPIGLLGMTLAALILAWPQLGYGATLAWLAALGFFGGFFNVPLMATIQHRTPRGMKGGAIAAMNAVTSFGILLGGGVTLLVSRIEAMNTYHVFLLLALLSAGVGAYICWALPYFFIRSVLLVVMNTIYRIKVQGIENVPAKGGALIVPNHTAYTDAIFVGMATDRQLRFLMSSEFLAKNPWVRPFARIGGAITVSRMDDPRSLIEALKEAREAIQAGHVVCVFPEGQLTRTGQLQPFHKGFEKIMKGIDAPIIPVYIDALWGSMFSAAPESLRWRWPDRVPQRVTVSFGTPMPPDATAYDVRQTVLEMGADAWLKRKLQYPVLHRGFLRNVRRHPFRQCIGDANLPPLSYFKTLVAVIIFGRKLKALLGPAQKVGVLVPTSAGAALTNLALEFMGKTPVNLNYTASNEAIASAAEQCGITHTITAHKLLERLPVEVPGEPIFLEDVKKSVQKSDRIKALLLALLPAFVIERALGRKKAPNTTDLATIIFSSGSEGKPKGVPLTHFNISANAEQVLSVVPHSDREVMIGFLPLFHSFGYTTTFWMPLLAGWGAIYHPTPLEPKAIGGLVYKHQCTFMCAAPTFLQNFIRRCLPEELSSLKFIIAGAEKLQPRLREAFKAKFGAEPLEGYGCTECSPVVSCNIPDERAPGYYQVGTKHGSIGKPIPGEAVKIVDPETGQPLAVNEPGMLLVKGPNIMPGYLDMPEKTAEVLKDGWYTTGDIASIDEDGFITITDRLARFSKIGGEMVPHGAVEEKLHQVLDAKDETLVAVTGVPDASKGERLVVLHVLEESVLEDLLGKLDSLDMPRLYIPRSSAFYRVEEIPVLGTGKLNLRAVKELAKQLDVG